MDRFSKLIALASLFLASCLLGTSCSILKTDPETGETVLDLEALERQLGLLVEDARDLSETFEPTNPKFSMAANEVAEALEEVRLEAVRIQETGEGNLRATAQTALAVLEGVLNVVLDDPDERQAAQAYVLTAKILLRRIEASS